jgi:hypothetical protein
MAMAFFPPAGALPERPSRLPRRRGVAVLLVALGLGTGGLCLVHAAGHAAAVQRPGPRRFPPAYHAHPPPPASGLTAPPP